MFLIFIIKDYIKVKKNPEANLEVTKKGTQCSQQVQNEQKNSRFKENAEKIESEWKTVLTLVNENIQEVYTKKENLEFEKNNLIKNFENIQKIMLELTVKYSKSNESELQENYIKYAQELDKIKTEINVIEEKINECKHFLQQLIEKKNYLQSEYDSIRKNISLELNKFELVDKLATINSAVDELVKTNTHHNLLSELKSSVIHSSISLDFEKDKISQNCLETELLNAANEKKYRESLIKSADFENLFTEIEKSNIPVNNKIDQLFK